MNVKVLVALDDAGLAPDVAHVIHLVVLVLVVDDVLALFLVVFLYAAQCSWFY